MIPPQLSDSLHISLVRAYFLFFIVLRLLCFHFQFCVFFFAYDLLFNNHIVTWFLLTSFIAVGISVV